MMSTHDLLAAYDVSENPGRRLSSGWSDLDALTGGFVPGRVWIVTGTPGQGRTTLTVQWAIEIAGNRAGGVHLVAPREPAPQLVARCLAQMARVPLSALGDEALEPTRQERLRAARAQLAGLPLSVAPRGAVRFEPERACQLPGLWAVAVDDADRVSGVTPAWAAACAESGKFVLLALPRHRVLDGPGTEPDVDAGWGGVADVVVEVRSRGLVDGAWRPGEADLGLRYNRWGPARTVPVHHQAHLARFTERPEEGIR